MKIIFVCTDNFTRSKTAEFCLKYYLSQNPQLHLTSYSAGINAYSDISKYSQAHIARMRELGIEVGQIKRTQFLSNFCNEFDLIIAMAKEHQDYFLKEYNKHIPLFNEVYKNENTSIVVSKPDSQDDVETQLCNMVDYINEAIPTLVRNITINIKT